MSEHLTQCPHCQTSFRVTDEQLAAAKGTVRCGSCLELFAASTNFIRLREQQQETTGSGFDDDIAFGDMNLDDEFEDDNSELDEIRSALREAEDLMREISDDVPQADEPEYETYEEYQETGSLFEVLPDSDSDAPEPADPETEDEEFTEDSEDDDSDDADEYGEAAGEEESDPETTYQADEEFHPEHEFLAEDEDEDFSEELAGLDDEDDYTDDEDEYLELTAESEEILEEFRQEYSESGSDEIHDSPDDDSLADSEADSTSASSRPQWLHQPEVRQQDKARLHNYLASLHDHDEEGLQPLPEPNLEELDQDPVTIAADSNRRSFIATAGLSLLSLLLLFTLVLQFVDNHLDQLLLRNSFSRYRPLFCSLLDCPSREITGISSELYSQELLIRTHPRIADALELSFIFHNDAAIEQAFPGLELSFRDIDNQLLANRLFLPGEYLPPELRTLDRMPARSSIQVILELADPGENAVNYTIAFRDI